MIRPLRRRHRHMFFTLGVLLPVAFATGIAARRSVPPMASLPGELIGSPQKIAITEWERADLFGKIPVKVRLLRESAGAGRFGVGFSAAQDFVKPDLMVYWIAGNSTVTDTVPDDAILLGGFNPSSVLPLPANAASSRGVLALYSLADQEMVEVSKPFTLPKL